MEADTEKTRSAWPWLVVAFVLAVTALAGGLVVLGKYHLSSPVEITLAAPPELSGQVQIGGAVANPGLYPFTAGDSVGSLIEAAGGRTSVAAPGRIELRVPEGDDLARPQRVDLNRAEAWLLQALPGMGEARAQAIVDYRRQNGPFHSVSDLLKVSGISQATLDRLRDLVTVTE